MKKEPEIRKEYAPPQKEYDEIRQVYERKSDMEAARQPFSKKWEKNWKQYYGFRPDKDEDDWSCDIHVPITSSIVEAELSEIATQSLKPLIIERGAEDTPKAIVMRHLFDYSWEVGKADVEMFDILKSALVTGTGIAQEYYLKQPRVIKVASGNKFVENEVNEYDDCYLEYVKLEDFFIDDRSRGFFGPFGARDCIRRYIMHIDDFRTFFRGKEWDPDGNARFVKPGGDTNYYEFYSPPQGIRKDKEVEVLWYWNKPEDKLVIVANDVRIVSKPNPYKHKQLPFARAADIKDVSQFYGRGEPDLLESIQEEANILRRQIIDRNHLDIDKPLLVSDKLTLDDEDTMAEPHKIIPVGDVSQAKWAEYSDIPQSSFRSLEMLQDDSIRATGMDIRQQSLSSSSRTTATEAAILKEATLKRLQLKIWMLKRDFLVDIGRLRVSNIMQFYSQPKMEKIVGEKGTQSYKMAVDEARSRGELVEKDGEAYRARYRNIRLRDKAISVNNGNISEIPMQGFSFFNARPEFFLPTHGGYDIRYEATSDLPLSKPLLIQQKSEMYDRLASNPTVDPWYLAKKYLEANGELAEDFQVKKQPQQQESQVNDLQKVVDLASMENEKMLTGAKIGSTPYAPVAHTEVHIEFMRSKNFKENASDEALQNFSDHVTGEIIAENSRGNGSGEVDLQGQGQPGGISSGTNQAPQMTSNAPPGMITGGSQVASASKSGPQVGNNLSR